MRVAAGGSVNHGSVRAGPSRLHGRLFPFEHGLTRRRLSAYVDGELDRSERERLDRHLGERLSTAEAAELLGLREAAFKGRLHRGRMTLRAHVARYVFDDEGALSGPDSPALS